MNNIRNIIISVFMGLYLLAPNAAYAKSSAPNELKVVMAKFLTVMVAVMVASFLLYVAALLVKRFFMPNYIKNEEIHMNSLNSPKDKEEAIAGFIMKNRLK